MHRSPAFEGFALVLSLLVPAVGGAQGPIERMAEVRREITAGNAIRALAILDTIAAVVPDHPNVPYLRAHALGRAGRMPEAEEAIRTLLRRDPRYAGLALRDSSVIALRARFPEVDSLVAAVSRPVSNARVWATIAEPDFLPEGTAYDPATRSVLVGSLNKYRVVAIAPDGSVSDRVAPGAGGVRSIAGIHVDTVRGVLWVASNARFDTPADSTPSALFAFDARTGAFRSRTPVPDGAPHFLNDVVTTGDGTVYVTDTRAGRVWRARPGAKALEPFTAIGPLVSPNGITVSSDSRVLFVADVDHVRGHDLASGTSWRIATPDSVGANGIDGLAFAGGALIAHHPLSFWKVARYPLDDTFRRITGREQIEANTPDSRTSTTGEVVGGEYVFIGNSQIDRMNLRTIDARTMEPIRMYRVPLPQAVRTAPPGRR